MTPEEKNRFQRLLAILSLGIVDALAEEILSTEEAEKLLFSPGIMNTCQKISAVPELHRLIHVGTELGSIKSLLPIEEWNVSLNEVRTHARKVLEHTSPSDPALDSWIQRLM